MERRFVRHVGMALAAGSLCACTATPSLVLPDGARLSTDTLPSLLAARPLGPAQNIRADLLAQTAALSSNLVQVRDRETPHLHAQHDLVVTLLRGRGTMHAAGGAFPMRAGDAASVPRGTVHYFVNDGSEPAVAFVTFAPPYDGTDQVPAP